MEQGKLIATNINLKLPCAAECQFGQACSQKYHDGECTERIDIFIAGNVFGTPGTKLISGGKISFETSDPQGKVSVSHGWVDISRPPAKHSE